jgi:hypothetical protein
MSVVKVGDKIICRVIYTKKSDDVLSHDYIAYKYSERSVRIVSTKMADGLIYNTGEVVAESYLGKEMLGKSVGDRIRILDKKTDTPILLDVLEIFGENNDKSTVNYTDIELYLKKSIDGSEIDTQELRDDEMSVVFDLPIKKESTFSVALRKHIRDSGCQPSEIYTKAWLNRKLWSKIQNDKNYSPSKPTVIKFALALKLDLEETEELLNKAGFSLSRSIESDLIIEYFIQNKSYNMFEINDTLAHFGQKML